MAGLREQWRRAAMSTIQERALDLFDERGFDAVTIEEIAASAEVSPSSIYRYFGTKEGIVVADELDTMSLAQVADLLDPQDPVGSLLAAVRAYESVDGQEWRAATMTGGPWRRVRYFFHEPTVRAAAVSTLDRTAQRIAPLLSAPGGLDPLQAAVAANAIAFGYFAALERWFTDGGPRPIAEYVEEGLAPLRRAWSTS